jgi:DNA-binding beta-propeller fold protein YncE
MMWVLMPALLAACSSSGSATSTALSYPTVSHLVISAKSGGFQCEHPGSPLGHARAIAVDRPGNVYISDVEAGYQRVEKVTPDGKVTVFAGNGGDKFQASEDGRPATKVEVMSDGLAIDAAGNVFISEVYGHIFRVGTDGIIHVVAGQGQTQRYSGDGGPARRADLFYPGGLAVDPAGNLYISDNLNFRVRRVSPEGRITTVAGTGKSGGLGDGGLATAAQLSQPDGLALDAAGNLYIADRDSIRKVTRDGMITTLAGNHGEANAGFGGLAVNDPLEAILGIAVDGRGNLYVTSDSIQDGSTQADQDGGLFVITPDGILHKIVPATVGYDSNTIIDVTSDPQGNIYYASDCGVYRLGWN